MTRRRLTVVLRALLLDAAAARDALDGWFGTLARYTGLGLLIYAVAVDRFRNPALLPAATAMMFLKTVARGGD